MAMQDAVLARLLVDDETKIGFMSFQRNAERARKTSQAFRDQGINNIVEGLDKQVRALKLSAKELSIFEASTYGANQAQIDKISKIYDDIDALKAQKAQQEQAVREQEEAQRASDSLAAAIERKIKALRTEAATLDMTEDQVEEYKLAQMGASKEQIRAVMAQRQHVAQLKEQAKVNKKTTQTLRFMRGGFGQVGHQIQDVAVQLQMGQNALLVFGQQGSQIVSLFGSGGALIGAFLAVGAAIGTALMPKLFETKDAGKELEEVFTDLSKVLEEDVNTGVFTVTDSFRRLAKESRDLAEIQLRGAYVKALHAANIAQDAFVESLDGLVAANENARNAGAGQTSQFEKFAKNMGISTKQARQLRREVIAVRLGQEGATQSLVDFIHGLTAQEGALERLTPEFIGLISTTLEYARKNKDATDKAGQLKEVMADLPGFLKATSDETTELVNKQQQFIDGLDEQLATLGMNKEELLRYKAAELGLAQDKSIIEKIQAIIDKMSELDEAKNIETLRTSLLTREEVLKEGFDKELALIESFASKSEDNEKLAAELKLRANKRYYEQLKKLREQSAEFEDKTRTEQTKMVLDDLGTMFQGVSANNKKLFAISKAYNISQAIMSTYTGATKALEQYPPPLSFAMAAAQIAAGLGHVAQIKAQSFDGGGFTGMGSRSGGMDGKGGFAAILHPNETVIDHTKGKSSGVTIVNNVDARGSGPEVDIKIQQAMEVTSQQTVALVQDLMRRRRM